MGDRKGLRRWLLNLGVISILVLGTGCGEAASPRTEFSAEQLLSQIEAICLNKAEEFRNDLRLHFQCDAQCYADATLVDIAVCKCQRERLKRDFSAEELQLVATIMTTGAGVDALLEEGVSTDSEFIRDYHDTRADALKGLSVEKIAQLSGAYSQAEAICSDEELAKSIVRSRS